MWPFSRKKNKTSRSMQKLQEKLIEAKLRQLRERRRFIYGKYDAAQTTDRNAGHWANADALSADAANSAQVRERLRQRARYEVANNSYAKGIVLTLANYVVGSGPRLQMRTGDPDLDEEIETDFEAWAGEIGLAEKLRTMHQARATDGEGFGILRNSESLRHPVTLDLQLIECDQVATPGVEMNQRVDGMELDEDGNPKKYHILKRHPGDADAVLAMNEDDMDRVDARSVIHWFRADRPGQHRGVPDITPAIPLFAQLRRYTLAVIEAAELAASVAGVVHSETPVDEAEQVEPMDTLEVPRGTLMTLPEGWDLRQIQAQQPATGYREFKREILTEIARCLNMPYNVAACDSSEYNYASGRLDHQTFFRSIRVDQRFMGRTVLDHILFHWLREAEIVGMVAGERLPDHAWFWDGQEHVDPSKEAKAQAKRLANHTTTLAEEYAQQGKDWEAELRQRAKEKQLMDELGLSMQEGAPAGQAGISKGEFEDMLEDAVERE